MPLAQTVHVRAMVTVVSTSDLETKDPVLEVEPTNQYGHTRLQLVVLMTDTWHVATTTRLTASFSRTAWVSQCQT